jgi:hypothetical protein
MGTGDVGLLLVFGSYQVKSAHYVLRSSDRTYEGDLPVDGENELRVRIGGVVADDNYNLTVTADSPDASFRCRGTAGPFSITSNDQAAVSLGFSCIRSPTPLVKPWEVNECPDILSVVATNAGGCSVLLHVDASDPDHKPEPLSYSWSNGMEGPDPAMECTADGPIDLNLTVSDGDRLDGCDAQFAVTVICPTGCGAAAATTEDGGMDVRIIDNADSGDVRADSLGAADGDGGTGGGMKGKGNEGDGTDSGGSRSEARL